MNYSDFVEALKNELDKRKIQYTDQLVEKNGKMVEGICLDYDSFIDNINLSPVIYPELLYKDFHYRDTDVCEVVNRILEETQNRLEDATKFTTSIRKYETAAPYLTCKLVNARRNKRHVESKCCLYKEFLDLYIIPIISTGEYVVEITTGLAEMWGVSEAEIIEVSMKNLENGKTVFNSPNNILGDNYDLPEEAIRMYVLTNTNFSYGASKILIPSTLKNIETKIGGKYWIIPSSVHECIIVPLEDVLDPKGIKELIKEVNLTEVDEKDYLSDNLYRYTGIKGKEIIIVDEEV